MIDPKHKFGRGDARHDWLDYRENWQVLGKPQQAKMNSGSEAVPEVLPRALASG